MSARSLAILLAALAVAVPATALDIAGAGGGSYAVPVRNLKASRFAATVHQQFDFSCGSAALATLLSFHYGQPVGEQGVFAEMYAGGDQDKIRREGFSLLDMKRYLAAHGWRADGFEQPLDKLVQAGFPAIVLVSDHGYRHFVVVKGLRDGRVLLGDPAGGARAMPRAAFEAIWQNRLLFVIHGWAGAPRFNDAADWRVAPVAPLALGVARDGLSTVTLPKNGGGNF
ncbi:C39 family peptidase [Rugamonas sp. CCM 8940]|uniref:C39 family peptidase n=1 Tax=Rugamonas sp. CCM 8940 TaxID=2765359 RepID=UPI0018F27BAE|nr:C39 family peptidase [Rugamonas sp. CCM 8940]MBJ7311639.1 C39 family peptidase [Rugamonas sp. CCM 8940]